MHERGRVLAIDDDHESLKLISDTLGGAGYEVRLADGATLGISSARVVHPELILLDSLMPGVDGLEACRRLKADEATRDIPIIFLSAAAGLEMKIAAFAAGAIDYVSKPFVPEELLARVRAHVELHRLEERLAQGLRQLAESEQRLELAAASARLGIWDWDVVNDRMIWNDQMFRLYGIAERPTAYGVEIWQNAVHPDDLAQAREASQAALRGGEAYASEFRVRHPDGTIRMIRADGLVIRDAKLEPVRMIGINRDVTDERRLEERLRQAEKLQALGQLAGGLAHDFNNQFAGVLGFAGLLVERLEDPTLNRWARGVVTATTHAVDLTKQLLAFSRDGMYLSVPVDAHTVIADVAALLGRSIDKRIGITQQLAAVPRWVLGDPMQLQDALLNLAVNARDAMPGGGTLSFATSAVELQADPADSETKAGRYLQVCVTDTGIGMDAETQKHLFEPFFTTRQLGRGSGIGLAAVHGAVRNHHGTIRVESRVGKGTTFTVCLPLLEGPSPAEGGESAAAALGEAHILVVDDEPVALEAIAEMLRALGHKVTTRKDGEEAVHFYVESWEHVDLVILDMVMPRMGGRDVFVALRKINPKIRVILSSGHSIAGDVQKLMDEGACAFLQKPYRLTDLSWAVAQSLQR